MKLSWSHAVLNVRDLDAMLDFYTGVLGFTVQSTMIGYRHSDQLRLTFWSVPREGIRGVRQTVQSDNLKHIKEVIYPLREEDNLLAF